MLDGEKSLELELLLLKVASDVHNRSELREIASIYKAKIIDLSPDSMVFELIGKPDKIDAFPENVYRLQNFGAVPHLRYRTGARRDASAYAEASAGGARSTAASAGDPLPGTDLSFSAPQ